ncbi:hypothetical protein A3A76_03525 [Candidatus Woesebacteria bacterium RIFCSPLOWO2_01_FULL_39_23]|uniref:Uncharacterized protein n=1 Tax=Candidatus Woesebacteria bacterium RIFCSPHIGHO2_01_FULL_40_22 TaxID=1802499 RepID=A0A1F7YJK9_9BACT|nr:MAG: hypothetical protein A2141_00500 [Candidatus Woesebacteria bacterium RBG_16_40_11]OGM27526.1 MAG: hypothetical protein A2628_01925 [Candidatus Woesebacteria bacterium RIFCSPHIGHO2_01_FULL_40_22]OGM36118.1 MAG: hypothetical protein A3E41_02165 [Candidatus Woesebacteria bacterium RIFCSPHIGHO2_12_FULL_38_9]OGM62700.1 MAG: hypothetical protein A3A76_03525 [Candidatus Woesebacteria bacterium RIFCSPLOWO2_01_FULL_39_23]
MGLKHEALDTLNKMGISVLRQGEFYIENPGNITLGTFTINEPEKKVVLKPIVRIGWGGTYFAKDPEKEDPGKTSAST